MPNQSSNSAFDQLDPQILQKAIKELIKQYQRNRSNLIAWIIVRYAEALHKHPSYADIQGDCFNYQRFSRQWRWLAQHNAPLESTSASNAVHQ